MSRPETRILVRLRQLPARMRARRYRRARVPGPPVSLPPPRDPEWAKVGRILAGTLRRAEDARASRERGDLSDRVALDQVLDEIRYAVVCAAGEEELLADSMHTTRVLPGPRHAQVQQ